MRVFKVLQGGVAKGDVALPALMIIPIVIGVLFESMIVTLLLPALFVAAGLYIKRQFFGGKAEWSVMLYRELFAQRGWYSNADKDI